MKLSVKFKCPNCKEVVVIEGTKNKVCPFCGWQEIKKKGGDKMKLTIMERLTLQQILPKEGSFLTLKVIDNLRSTLSFNEKELEKFGMKSVGNQIKWNVKSKDQTVEIEVSEAVSGIIIEILKKLDKEKRLTLAHISLYEKFVIGKVEEKREEKSKVETPEEKK